MSGVSQAVDQTLAFGLSRLLEGSRVAEEMIARCQSAPRDVGYEVGAEPGLVIEIKVIEKVADRLVSS